MGILTSLSGPWAEAIIPLVVDGQCGRGASYEDSNISASYLLPNHIIRVMVIDDR